MSTRAETPQQHSRVSVTTSLAHRFSHQFIPLLLALLGHTALLALALPHGLFITLMINGLSLALSLSLLTRYKRRSGAGHHVAAATGELQLSAVEALATAIEAKDHITHDHVRRVQIYATGLARVFGLSEAEVEALRTGALLHDVGKLGVPDYILNKPGKLTAAEFDRMKTHPEIGAEILSRIDFPYPVVPVVLHHHERWDGLGYPHKLKGTEIPLTARILSVTDCFDALHEDRQYRRALSREEAIAIIQQGRGTLYDPLVVDTFIAHLPAFEAEIAAQKLELQTGTSTSKISRGQQLAHDGAGPGAARTGTAAQNYLQEILQQLIGQVQTLVPYTTCAVFLREPEQDRVTVAYAAGRHAAELAGRQLQLGVGLTGWVIINNRAMVNADPALDLTSLGLNHDNAYRTSLVVPLVQEQTVLGALALYATETGAYSGEQQRLLEFVATLAASALAEALKHEENELAHWMDRLTGLPNFRSLSSFFEQEASRARRHRQPFTILVLKLTGSADLDSYTGNRQRMEMAEVLRRSLRGYDSLARQEDEFLALLPETAKTEIDNILVRLTDAVETMFYRRFGQQSVCLQIGAAQYGADGETLADLLAAARHGLSPHRTAADEADNSSQIIDLRDYRRPAARS